MLFPGKAVGAVVSALRGASVTDEQVAGAKKQLLADVYTLMEDPLQMVENMGVQVRLVHMDSMEEKFMFIIANHFHIVTAAAVRRRDACREIPRDHRRHLHR